LPFFLAKINRLRQSVAGLGNPFTGFGKRIDRQPSRRDAWFLPLASEADDIP
jgi:hypothetical protein